MYYMWNTMACNYMLKQQVEDWITVHKFLYEVIKKKKKSFGQTH